MQALRGLAVLLLLQATGEALAHGLSLVVPGPVVGLLLLLPALHWNAVRRPVEAAADVLLAHLSLLFVPVGVGVVVHLRLLSEHAVPLLVVVVVSTWVGLAVTALTLRVLLRPRRHKETPRGR